MLHKSREKAVKAVKMALFLSIWRVLCVCQNREVLCVNGTPREDLDSFFSGIWDCTRKLFFPTFLFFSGASETFLSLFGSCLLFPSHFCLFSREKKMGVKAVSQRPFVIRFWIAGRHVTRFFILFSSHSQGTSKPGRARHVFWSRFPGLIHRRPKSVCATAVSSVT